MSGRRARAPAIAASGAFLASCVVAPIVQPAGKDRVDESRLPDGAQVVVLSTRDGVQLRGAFVDAGRDAPVILHLLPSESSITSGVALGGIVAGMRETLEFLREEGFASLVVDYRGVGASGGERDPRRLGDDAGAMWSEALRRAGGESDRVVLRGASIGCLAAVALLDAGVLPGGVVLFAPVRAETIGRHAARERHGPLLGSSIAVFLRKPLDVDLVGTLAASPSPMLVFLPERDVYLTPDESEEVAAAATASGARLEHLGGSHHAAVLRAWGFTLDEARFAGRITPELVDAERAFLASLERMPTASTRR